MAGVGKSGGKGLAITWELKSLKKRSRSSSSCLGSGSCSAGFTVVSGSAAETRCLPLHTGHAGRSAAKYVLQLAQGKPYPVGLGPKPPVLKWSICRAGAAAVAAPVPESFAEFKLLICVPALPERKLNAIADFRNALIESVLLRVRDKAASQDPAGWRFVSPPTPRDPGPCS